MSDKFDDLIRQGEDIKAYKMLIKELYNGGKMGGTRKSLMERIVDRLEKSGKRMSQIKKAVGG